MKKYFTTLTMTIVALLLLTSCGGGTANVPTPDLEDDVITLPTVEHILTIQADRPINLYGFVRSFGTALFVDGVNNLSTSYNFNDTGETDSEDKHKKSYLPANTKREYHFQTQARPYIDYAKAGAPLLELSFSFSAVDAYVDVTPEGKFQMEYEPVITTVTFNWMEKINGKVTNQESKTIRLREDNSFSYKSRDYKTVP